MSANKGYGRGVYAEAYARLGSYRAVAREFGVDPSTVSECLKSAPQGQLAAVEAAGLDLSSAKHGWRVIQHEDGSRDSVFWKNETTPEELVELVREAFCDIPAAPQVNPPPSVNSELCTVYPLMDVHFGMMAWGRETGSQDYDMSVAHSDMLYAFDKVGALTPASERAVLLIGGDFFHANDNNAETPRSKHKLDTDSRHWKVLDKGIELIAHVIERLTAKHHDLTVRVLRGNHDEESHLVLTFALAERYRDSDRITIEKKPFDLFMMQWGQCLIAAHHGDKHKPQQSALYLSDVCPFWSETRHRHMLTGHVHHDQAKDVGPLRWESLRAFCPPDAYAASMGYGARRAMQALTFDKKDGLVLRAIDPIER